MMRVSCLVAGLLLLGVWHTADPGVNAAEGRQVRRPMPAPIRPQPTPLQPVGPRYEPNRMPGWDWWRIYPWSPYNYGRNPYNPAIVPYYPPYPPYYPLYPQDYAMNSLAGSWPDGSMVPRQQAPQVLVPHPTGELRVAPPDAAVIELRIPDAFGQVSFDGVKTSSVGTTRYYVTPDLKSGSTASYTVTATWTQDGQTVSAQKTVPVSPGHFSVVSFTR